MKPGLRPSAIGMLLSDPSAMLGITRWEINEGAKVWPWGSFPQPCRGPLDFSRSVFWPRTCVCSLIVASVFPCWLGLLQSCMSYCCWDKRQDNIASKGTVTRRNLTSPCSTLESQQIPKASEHQTKKWRTQNWPMLHKACFGCTQR